MFLRERLLSHDSGSDGESVETRSRRGSTQFAAAAADPPWAWEGKQASGSFGTSSSRTLGTFNGVFIPCMNSIFGVVLFLRWGWSVGQIGILGAMSTLLLGTLVSLITVAHVSALATNGEVEVGGAYFLLSRALGPEFGGAVGLLFFAACFFSVGLYALGFVEVVLPVLGAVGALPCQWTGLEGWEWGCDAQDWFDSVALSAMVLLIFLVVNLVGSSLFARISIWVFVIVVSGVILGLSSIVVYSIAPKAMQFSAARGLYPHNVTGFVGLNWATMSENFLPEMRCEQGECVHITAFYVVGVILPAVTGLLNGASMSGNLVDPGKSIPAGTFFAVLTMVMVYGSVILLQGASFERSALRQNYQTFQDVSAVPELVLLSTVFATMSPGLATMAGMARVLQAQCKDGLYGKQLSPIFAKGHGPQNEPRAALVLSWFLSQLVCLVGSVNIAASLVTIFTFACYAALNIACGVLASMQVPNFRPLFKYYSWHLSIVGAVLSLAVSFTVDSFVSAVSVGLAAAAFVGFALTFSAKANQFADVSQAMVYHWSHRYLLRLDLRKASVKYWRPQVLVLVSGEGDHDRPIVRLASELRQSSAGLLVVGQVLIGDVGPRRSRGELGRADVLAVSEQLSEEVEATLGPSRAFSTVTTAPNYGSGASNLLLGPMGVGPIRANTLVLEFPDGAAVATAGGAKGGEPSSDAVANWASALQKTTTLGCTVVCTRGFVEELSSPTTAKAAAAARSWRSSLTRHAPTRPAAAANTFGSGGGNRTEKHIERIVARIFPDGKAPLVDMRFDVSRHGPRAGLTIDVWILGLVDFDNNRSIAWEAYQARTLVLLQLGFMLHLDTFWRRFTRLRALVLTPSGDPSSKAVKWLEQLKQSGRFAGMQVVPVSLRDGLHHYDPSYSNTETDSSVGVGEDHARDSLTVGSYCALSNEARLSMLNDIVRRVSSDKAGLVLLQATASLRDAATQSLAPLAPQSWAYSHTPGEMWGQMDSLSRHLPCPALLVFASDEEVTTDKL